MVQDNDTQNLSKSGEPFSTAAVDAPPGSGSDVAKPGAWKIKRPADRILIAGGSAVAVVAMGISTFLMFLPAVAGATVALASGAVIAENTAAWKRRKLARKMETQKWEPAPDDDRVIQIVADVAKEFGRSRAPKVFITPGKKDDFFAAMPEMDVLLTTRASLDRFTSDSDLRFIIAHEMAHLQADRRSPIALAHQFMQRFGDVSSCAIILSWGLSLFGIGLPVMAALGTTAIVGTVAAGMISILGLQFSSRQRENRADRNALYITRDLQAAENVVQNGEPSKRENSRLVELFRSHPSCPERLKALRHSFKLVAAYPRPDVANENPGGNPGKIRGHNTIR